MRIISGSLKGRIFEAPSGHKTHPMSEKIRGAIFNALGDIEGLTVIDAFAGTGAVGFEAISRGAKSALLIEHDNTAKECIERNIKSLEVDGQAKLTRANVSGWSDNNPSAQFSIVVLDPPYDDIKPNLLNKLLNHLSKSGIAVISLPSFYSFKAPTGYKIVQQKDYGDAQLVFLKKIQ